MNSQAKNTALPNYSVLWSRITEVLGTTKTGEIAEILGLSPSSVSDWKAGRTTPSMDTLHSIAFEGLSTIEYLIYGEPKFRHHPGSADWFDPWVLPADVRITLKKLAKKAGMDDKEYARKLLLDAIEREVASDLGDLKESDLRRIIREEVGSYISVGTPIQELGDIDEFLANSIKKHDNPRTVLEEWYRAEGWPTANLSVPQFHSWPKLTLEQKVAEIKAFRDIYIRHLQRHEILSPKTPKDPE